MPLIVSSPSTATRPGFYFYSVNPPASIVPLGTGIAGLVEQFPWGPSQVLYSPSSDGDRANTFAPAGMSRLGSGYLAMIQKGWPLLKVIRVEGSAAVASTVTISSSAPATLFTVAGKYPGTAGNAITVTISPASNGNVAFFNMAASVTGASGTTTDTFTNLTSAAGTVSGFTAAQLQASLLVGAITWIANGNPVVGTSSMAGGTDGTIAAIDYTGNAGTTDKGLALFEGDLTVSHKFFGDPTAALRPACNAGLKAHANLMANAMCYFNGIAGQTDAAAQTDAALYQTNYGVYAHPWAYEYDDTSGATQLVPSASFIASLGAQTSPSTRLAARDPSITQFLGGIVKLERNSGMNAPINTAAGVTTIIPNVKGGFCLELDVTTNSPQNLPQADVPTWRMAIYVAGALNNSLQSFVNGPNVSVTQDSIKVAISDFMDGLKAQQNQDPLHLPYVLDWAFGNIASYNTPASIAAGNFIIPLSFQTDAGMQKIFVAATFGPTATVNVSATQPQVGG